MHQKHTWRRNMLLLFVLVMSMAFSCIVTIRRLEGNTVPVSLPVSSSSVMPAAVEALRLDIQTAEDDDLAALREIIADDHLDDAAHEAAAGQLQSMIRRREQRNALEAALSATELAPCVVIVTEGSVTVVTGKESLTAGESAMVVTLAQAHAGVLPSGVRVLTGQSP